MWSIMSYYTDVSCHGQLGYSIINNFHHIIPDSNKRCFRAQHEIHPNKFTKYTLRDTDLTDDKLVVYYCVMNTASVLTDDKSVVYYTAINGSYTKEGLKSILILVGIY